MLTKIFTKLMMIYGREEEVIVTLPLDESIIHIYMYISYVCSSIVMPGFGVVI